MRLRKTGIIADDRYEKWKSELKLVYHNLENIVCQSDIGPEELVKFDNCLKEIFDVLISCPQLTAQTLAIELNKFRRQASYFSERVRAKKLDHDQLFDTKITQTFTDFIQNEIADDDIVEFFWWIMYFDRLIMDCCVQVMRIRDGENYKNRILECLRKNDYQQIYGNPVGGPIPKDAAECLEYALSFFTKEELKDLCNNAPVGFFESVARDGSPELFELLLQSLMGENLGKLLCHRNYRFIRVTFGGSIFAVRNNEHHFRKVVIIFNYIQLKFSSEKKKVRDLIYHCLILLPDAIVSKNMLLHLEEKFGKPCMEQIISLNNFHLFQKIANYYDSDLIAYVMTLMPDIYYKQLWQYALRWLFLNLISITRAYLLTRESLGKLIEMLLENAQEKDFDQDLKLLLDQEFGQSLKLSEQLEMAQKHILGKCKAASQDPFDKIEKLFLKNYMSRRLIIGRGTKASDEQIERDLERVDQEIQLLSVDEIKQEFDTKSDQLNELRHYRSSQFLAFDFYNPSSDEKENYLIELLSIDLKEIEEIDLPQYRSHTTLWPSMLEVKHGSKQEAKDVIIPGTDVHGRLRHTLNRFLSAHNNLETQNYAIANIGFVVSKRNRLSGRYVKKFYSMPLVIPENDIPTLRDFEPKNDRELRRSKQNIARDKIRAFQILGRTGEAFSKEDQEYRRIHHSEQAIYEYLTTDCTAVEKFLEFFEARGYSNVEDFKLHDIILDICTRYQMCEQCGVRGLGLQNSNQEGFLSNFQSVMRARGLRYPKKGIRMLIRVTAVNMYSGAGMTVDNRRAGLQEMPALSLSDAADLHRVDPAEDKLAFMKCWEHECNVKISEIILEDTEEVPREYQSQLRHKSEGLYTLKGLAARKILALPHQYCKRLREPVKPDLNRYSVFSSRADKNEASRAYQAIFEKEGKSSQQSNMSHSLLTLEAVEVSRPPKRKKSGPSSSPS